MRIGVHYKSVVQGLVMLGVACGLAWGYWWLVTVRIAPTGRTGQQILIMMFAPVATVVFLQFVGRAFKKVWLGFTRYAILENGLVVNGPLRTRTISWQSIRDFILPANTFPKAPGTLVLVMADSRIVRLPLVRFRDACALELLTGSVPGLNSWDIERVRSPAPKTLSPLQVRWHRIKPNLFLLYFGLTLLPLMTLGVVAFSWDFFNYLRISRSHLSSTAQITEITTDDTGKDEKVWVRVVFKTWNGRSIKLHRKVLVGFRDRFKVGDQIAVDYLPDNPSIARIPGWDLDGRQWILAVMSLPLLWVMFAATKRALAECFGPLRRRLAWVCDPSCPRLGLSNASLGTLHVLLPDAHVGTLVLKPTLPGSPRQLKAAGIETRQAMKRFVILSPTEARRLYDRLGSEESFSGDYFILDCKDNDEAEQILLQYFSGLSWLLGGSLPEKTRFHCAKSIVAPLEPDQRRQLFGRWISSHLSNLFGGQFPPDIPAADFAGLFNIDPADGAFDLLIERRSTGARIWLRNYETGSIQMAECLRGRWFNSSHAPTPKVFRKPLRKRLFPALAKHADPLPT
jgi:hypothetical protein